MPPSPPTRTLRARKRRRPALRVALLRRFEFTVDGNPRELGRGPARVVALLALDRPGLSRAAAASILTPHLDPASAASSLRTQLSRLRARAPADLVEDEQRWLRLASRATVDVPEVEALAAQLEGGAPPPPDVDVGERLSQTLLPGWDADWLGPVRARLNDRSLDALEMHARDLWGRDDRDGAFVILHQMLKAEPLREATVGLQLEIYRAQWNRAKVARVFRAFEEQLRATRGAEPSPELRELVARLMGDGTPDPVQAARRQARAPWGG